MLSDMKSVWPMIVSCDLHCKPDSVSHILDKLIARPPIALSYAMPKD
jgi:hypothetical protein